MKIAINLEYEDDQIVFFCKDKGLQDDDDITEFATQFLKNHLSDLISAPFIEKVRRERMEEDMIMNEGIRNNVLN